MEGEPFPIYVKLTDALLLTAGLLRNPMQFYRINNVISTRDTARLVRPTACSKSLMIDVPKVQIIIAVSVQDNSRASRYFG